MNNGILKYNLIFLFIALLSFNVLTCNSQQPAGDTLSVVELKKQIKDKHSLIVLDVRTKQELNGPLGSIRGVINIPIQDLEKRINELNKYKNREIAVICRSGNRSELATKILREYGFKAKNVLGGMQEYRKVEKH